MNRRNPAIKRIVKTQLPKVDLHFVWEYFQKEGITSTCEIIMGDWKNVVTHNDGSTTSNLINHLARKPRRKDDISFSVVES